MNTNRNKISKKAGLAVLALGALGILGVGGIGVSALSSDRTKQDGLASRIATRFGLSQDEVAKEVDSYRQEKHIRHEDEMKARLGEALQKKVDDGTITAEQKTAIENKLEEKHKAHEAESEDSDNTGVRPTKEEVDARRAADKSEMDAWLKEQGINLDLKDVIPARHDERGPGRMMEGGRE